MDRRPPLAFLARTSVYNELAFGIGLDSAEITRLGSGHPSGASVCDIHHLVFAAC